MVNKRLPSVPHRLVTDAVERLEAAGATKFDEPGGGKPK
jgi:hypothetical protein